jgi:hypothetical protein
VILNNRKGFAIPTAILVIGVLSISIAAGFSLVIAERRGVDDQKAQVSAFVLAEHGLQLFMVRRDSLGFNSVPPAVTEGPVTIYMNGGYAQVRLDRVRPPIGSLAGLYVIRSRGVQTRGAVSGTPAGVRTVAQYAAWEPATMDVMAGWTAIQGIQKNGNSGSFLGVDACGDSAALAGVAVPISPGFNRPAVADSIEYDGSNPYQMANLVNIMWSGIVSGQSLTPTVTIPPGPLPSFADTSFYPVIKIVGDAPSSLWSTMTSAGGRGLLVVTGTLSTLGNNFNWKGIILVGNGITGNGSSDIDGAIISGLNFKLGQYVPIDTANGIKTYQYNSCEVAKALQGLGALVPLQNTWVDNWVEY